MMNLYFSPLSLKKLVCNKYIMNPSNSWLTISLFLTFLAYIFSEPISLKYHCTFFLYKVIDLSISIPYIHQRELFVSTTTNHRAFHIKPPDILVRKNESYYLN